jgi:hypothetical protein
MTTVDDVVKTVGMAERLSEMTGIPVAFTAVNENIYADVAEKLGKNNVFPLQLQEKLF